MANIVVIAPHPDDAEIGMGGTIARLADQGHDVLICDLTDGCPTPYGDRPTRLNEAAAALECLQPAAGNGRPIRRAMLDLLNRRVEHTIENRHKVAGVYRAHQAEIVFLPHPEDAHPDHLAATRIATDARFDAKLTGLQFPGDQGRPPIYPRCMIHYYCSHLRAVPEPSFIFDTTTTRDRKRRSIEAYASQFVQNLKNRRVLDMLSASDAYFGSRIGVEAGEPFWMREPAGLNSLASLVP